MKMVLIIQYVASVIINAIIVQEIWILNALIVKYIQQVTES